MLADFCVEALEEALARHGRPEIFNTDQGSQFTSADFTGAMETAGVRISMDGKGRFLDNIFTELLWRSLKYEDVYLHADRTGGEARHWSVDRRLQRPRATHQALADKTPDDVYFAAAQAIVEVAA